jgi:hypothetical protein
MTVILQPAHTGISTVLLLPFPETQDDITGKATEDIAMSPAKL